MNTMKMLLKLLRIMEVIHVKKKFLQLAMGDSRANSEDPSRLTISVIFVILEAMGDTYIIKNCQNQREMGAHYSIYEKMQKSIEKILHTMDIKVKFLSDHASRHNSIY